MTLFSKAKTWARALKRDVIALWLAARDPRTPWLAKLVAAAVAAYALSPIDLIPDFIPIIGYLDDLVLVPWGIVLAIKLLPPQLMGEFRAQAQRIANKPTSRAGFAFTVSVWTVSAAVIGYIVWR